MKFIKKQIGNKLKKVICDSRANKFIIHNSMMGNYFILIFNFIWFYFFIYFLIQHYYYLHNMVVTKILIA